MLRPEDALPRDPDEDQEASESTRPLRPVLRTLRWALGAYIAGQAANAMIGLWYLVGPAPEDIGFTLFEPMETAVSWIFIATLVIAAACYFRFIARALDNLKIYSSRHIQDSPLGAIVWHFIPGIGWIKPYSLMRLLWVRSHNPV